VDHFSDVDLIACCPALRVRNLRAEMVSALRACPEGAWMYTGPIENYPDLVAIASRDRPLYGNTEQALREVRDPWRVVQCLRRAGVPCPDLHPECGVAPPGTWLRKPLRSGGGRGIVRLHGTRAIDRVACPVIPPGSTHYLQRAVPGKPCSAVFAAAAGQAALLGVTQQLVGCRWANASLFGYAGSLTWPTVTQDQLVQFQRIGEALAREFALVGLFGVDAVANTRGVWPVEINPRYTASVELLERATGVQAVAVHAAACRDHRLPQSATPPTTHCLGKAVIYARRQIVVGPAFHDFVARENTNQDWPRIADVPASGERLVAGQPLVTVFAAGESTADVRRRLRRFAHAVHAVAIS
jgi:predicted ATP-grasp superfamily ATP-dependent carboligase